MSNSPIFSKEKILQYINLKTDYLSISSLESPRAVGDAIQDIIANNIAEIMENASLTYKTDFARRGMADLAFSDSLGYNYVIDVKTHNRNTEFNMPNLTSVKRLADFYGKGEKYDSNYFVLLTVAYVVLNGQIVVQHVNFLPIEFFDWNCLTVGALGWGQIQIANSNKILINDLKSRKDWMLGLCNKMITFYPKEVEKIKKRLVFFETTKKFWEEK